MRSLADRPTLAPAARRALWDELWRILLRGGTERATASRPELTGDGRERRGDDGVAE